MYIVIIFIFILIIYNLFYFVKKHKNVKKQKLSNDYYINIIINFIISGIIVFTIILNRTKFFLTNNMPNIPNIIFYLIVVDTLFYWNHRIIHRIPTLKQFLHITHHNNYNLLPIDGLHSSIFENIINTLITNIFPLFIVNINLVDYLIISIILTIHILYIHSDSKQKFILPLFIDSKFHRKHHQIGGGNYSAFFSIWDDYMGTRIKKPKIKSNSLII